MSKQMDKRPRSKGEVPSETRTRGRTRSIVIGYLAIGVILGVGASLVIPQWFSRAGGRAITDATPNDSGPADNRSPGETGSASAAAPGDGSVSEVESSGDSRQLAASKRELTETVINTSELLGCQPSWNEIDDPRKDGWDTEAFNDQAGGQLKRLGKLLVHPEKITVEAVAELAAEDFSCASLRPARVRNVYEDDLLKVERGDIDADTAASQPPGPHRGHAGLAEVLRELAEPLRGARDVRFKFKIVRVIPAENGVTTHQYFALSGRTPRGVREQNAMWIARWLPGQTPQLQWVGVTDFEEVSTRNGSGPLFVDCTASVLGGNTSYGEQMLYGCNYWLERIENMQDMALFGTPGIAMGDVNGDQLDDLYLCQEPGLPNRLLVRRPDGTLHDTSDSAGVNWLDGSRSALLIDLDNDGDQDLVVAATGNLVVASNDGQGRFATRTLLPTSDDTMSICAADYDRDADLDLYVCGYNPDRKLDKSRAAVFASAAENFVFHDANNGAPNRLYRNDVAADGVWRLTDVTAEVGLDVNNRRYSFAASWEDFDNDGDQDLYVANDYGRDNLYRNDTGLGGEVRFADVSDTANAEDSAGGMSISWGDYDRDGWMDTYVSNMFSSAGNRVTYQPKFKPDVAEEVKTRLQRFARGNTLLRNRGDGTFDDVSGPSGVEMGRWAWGSLFVDFNSDGWEDLFVANGYMTADDTGDL